MINTSFFHLIWFGCLFMQVISRRLVYQRHQQHQSQMDNSDYCCSNNECKSPNVRTTLFKKAQASNLCWNMEEIALLLARAIMQDILPRTIPQNMPLLLDYFKDCLATIKKQVTNNYVQNLMTAAMIDTLGGYLQAYGLPIMKKIYYEGNLEFDTVNEFYSLQNNMKTILSTDGGGWTRPVIINWKITSVIPLKIPISNDNCCKDIITTYDYCKYRKNLLRFEKYDHNPKN